MFSWPIMPGCRHLSCFCWRSGPSGGSYTANQIVLPGFLSSMIGCTDLCRKLLPSHLQSMTGSLDRHFIDACEQWKRRTPCHTTFRSATEEMRLATCRRYVIVATEHCTKPGCRRTPIRGVTTTCSSFPTCYPDQRNRHAYGRQVHPHSSPSWCSSMR